MRGEDAGVKVKSSGSVVRDSERESIDQAFHFVFYDRATLRSRDSAGHHSNLGAKLAYVDAWNPVRIHFARLSMLKKSKIAHRYWAMFMAVQGKSLRATMCSPIKLSP